MIADSRVIGIHALPHDELATFDDFWAVCIKKVGKPLTRAKWEAITNGGLTTRTLDRDSGTYVEIELSATPAELIAGMRRYRDKQIERKTYRLRDDGKFVLHPATWLNQGRWLDD